MTPRKARLTPKHCCTVRTPPARSMSVRLDHVHRPPCLTPIPPSSARPAAPPPHILTILMRMLFLAACLASFSSALRRASGGSRAMRSWRGAGAGVGDWV